MSTSTTKGIQRKAKAAGKAKAALTTTATPGCNIFFVGNQTPLSVDTATGKKLFEAFRDYVTRIATGKGNDALREMVVTPADNSHNKKHLAINFRNVAYMTYFGELQPPVKPKATQMSYGDQPEVLTKQW